MKVKLQGTHTTDEAVESLITILLLLKDRYAVKKLSHIELGMQLLDEKGQVLELIDLENLQPLRCMNVYKSKSDQSFLPEPQKSSIHLVVDNTANIARARKK